MLRAWDYIVIGAAVPAPRLPRVLSIADASVVPCIASANTNATAIAIAERAAERVKARAA